MNEKQAEFPPPPPKPTYDNKQLRYAIYSANVCLFEQRFKNEDEAESFLKAIGDLSIGYFHRKFWG